MTDLIGFKGAPRKVLIADDEAINRLGLRFLLGDVPNIEVIGEVSNGREAVSFATNQKPDVVLMDVHMPELDGIAATRAIRKMAPDVKVLILTSRNNESDLSAALAAGASGYCLKDSSPEEFMVALEVVCKGNTYLDAKVMPLLVGALTTAPAKQDKTDNYQALSDHEIDLLTMRMDGAQDAEIATRFNASLDGLRVLEDNIRQKISDLGARSAFDRTGAFSAKVCGECDALYPVDATVCGYDGSALFLETLTNRIGSTLGGKYKILEYVGRGGGASVYKAHHRYLNQIVAVKIIHSEFATDFTMLQRFKREAEVLGRLEHPGVVKITDFGLSEAGTPYLVMEFLQGVCLSTFIKIERKLDVSQFMAVFSQVCAALEYAHSNGLVHRDIKPGNIFLTERNASTPGVKLVDFGLAKAFAAETKGQLTKYGQIVGTPSYMSPEVCKGDRDSIASDIYSLGCTMFECLTGLLPFVGQSPVDTMFKHIRDEVPDPYPEGAQTAAEDMISKVVKRCMQKDPTARYESASHIQHDLARLSDLVSSGTVAA